MKNYVLFHGLGASTRSFDPLSVLLRTKGHTVIAGDFCGFGTRVGEGCAENPLDNAVSELAARLAGHTNLHFIAHSMGAAIALQLAGKMPQKIGSVTLIEGNLIAEDCGMLSRAIAAAQNTQDLARQLKTMTADLKDSPQKGWRLWAEEAENVTPEVMKAYARQLVTASDSGELLRIFRALPCEKLYLYGDDYQNHPVLKHLENIPAHYIKGTGHFVMTEKPEACLEKIMQL